MKKNITNLIYFVFNKVIVWYETLREQKKIETLKKNCSLGSKTKITSSTKIYNFRNDPTLIKIGGNCLISGAEFLLFKHGGQISVGDHCFIGMNSKLWSSNKISIGNRVLISHNVNIHDNNSHPLDSKYRHEEAVQIFETGLLEETSILEKEITIEDDVWIGFNSIILKGVKIGKGAIIGAGTIVTSDVPDYAVLVGNPPRIIKFTT